jgi:hypothetical protein
MAGDGRIFREPALRDYLPICDYLLSWPVGYVKQEAVTNNPKSRLASAFRSKLSIRTWGSASNCI